MIVIAKSEMARRKLDGAHGTGEIQLWLIVFLWSYLFIGYVELVIIYVNLIDGKEDK